MTYPAANTTAQWFYGDVSTSAMGAVEKVVWHSTEGNGWPSYGGGATAPHYTVKPNFSTQRMEWRAHFPDTQNARALQNDSGGVETNRDGALQVEIVGTCDETKNWGSTQILKTWALPTWAIDGLAEFSAWAYREHDVPLKAPSLWLAYGVDPRAPGVVPASYGASPARFTHSTWSAFRGHCGHQHVPENDHGDPGRMPVNTVLLRAQQIITPPATRNPIEEFDMFLASVPGADPRVFLCGAAGKREVPDGANGAVFAELKSKGIPHVGDLSSAALNMFPTLGGLFERLVPIDNTTAATSTELAEVHTVVDQLAAPAGP